MIARVNAARALIQCRKVNVDTLKVVADLETTKRWCQGLRHWRIALVDKNIKTRIERLERIHSMRDGTPNFDAMPPRTGYPPAELTGWALVAWVRNVKPGSNSVAALLAETYFDAAFAAETVTTDAKIMRRVGELALREHEGNLRAGVDVEISLLLDDDDAVLESARLRDLLDRAGWTDPSLNGNASNGPGHPMVPTGP